MRSPLERTILALALSLALPAAAWATDVDGPDDCQRTPVDFGDAPEGVQAYPGILGNFPTCLAAGAVGTATSDCGAVLPPPGPTGFVRHVHLASQSNYWLGCGVVGAPPSGIDPEADGKTNDNGAPVSACNPAVSVDCFETAFGLTFGQDECYGSTDAGLASPVSFSACTPSSFSFQTYSCATATRRVFLNVLIDWNQDGDWNDEVACPNQPAAPCVREWAVQNVAIDLPPGCGTITTPTFPSGPKVGPGWMRVTISDQGVPQDFAWNGSAGVAGQALTNGETEDYPITIHQPPQGCLDYQDWGDAPEEVQAYPGVPGHFPTCSGPSPPGTFDVVCAPLSTPPGLTGFVRHIVSSTANVGFWLGCGDGTAANPGVDGEPDGKMNDTGAPTSTCLATLLTDCTEFLGLSWGQDECYGDLDAGVTSPTNLIFKTCTSTKVDFRTFNCKNQATDAFLNILVDMNEDGDWNDNLLCPGANGCAYEWAVKNVPIVLLPGCQPQTSPSFLMGPREGKGWMRITLTSTPVSDDFPWDGSAGPNGDGAFFAGETEDYPVVIRSQTVGVGTPDDFTRLAFAPLAPNPAKGQVMARFTLPQRADVSLAAYDVAGRKLAEIVSGRLEAGEHRIAWDFTDRQGRAVAAGYYLIKLRVGDRVLTQRGIRVR